MNCKTADGLNIYYEVQGNNSSEKTVVFLNGLTQSTMSWGLFMPCFKTDYKVILIDFIFQGQSDKTASSRDFNEHAADVKRVLDEEKIEKATLVGISYGSLVAQNFSVLYPESVEQLILLSTFAHKTPYFEAIEHAWGRALEAGGYNLLVDIMFPTVLSENYFSKPLIPLEVMKQRRLDSNQNKEAIFNLMRATKERKDYRQELKQIKIPTLIIHGEKDLLIPSHMGYEVHLNIKDSKYIIVKNAGHTLNLEKFDEVCDHIIKFL
jgi:3-oxoadipate enol-lactonase